MPMKKGGKGIKSLSMMIFKRTSAEIGGFDMSAFDPPGSLTPSEDNRSSTSLGMDGESDGDTDADKRSIASDRQESATLLPQPVISRSATSISESHMSTTDYTPSKRPESLASLTSIGTTDTNRDVLLNPSPLSSEQASSPLGSLSAVQSRFDTKSQDLSQGSLSERRLRRRAVSNPTPKAPNTLLKKNTFKKTRPRANTDSILQATADILNDTNISEKGVSVRILMPSLQALNLKLPSDMRMDYVLCHVCQTNSLEFDSFTFKVFDKGVTVEMDRVLGYYVTDLKITEFMVSHGEKFYRTRVINEDGKDVMIFEVVQDRLQVMAGTPEKLIERLTDEDEKDVNFIDTMLLTYRSFMSPDDFFQNLLDRFNCELADECNSEDREYFTKMKSPVQKGVVNVISWWVEHHWHDFGVNPQLRKDMEAFVEELSACGETDFRAEQIKLEQLITAQSKRYEDMILSYKGVERKGKTMESMFSELNPEELGQQLCLHDFKLFRNIHPIEFLHQIWKKDDDGAPILDFFIERFDKESYWAVTEIVSQKDPKKRVNILRKFILTAKACQENKNFFSMFALIAGISLSPVSRLKKTWEALGDKVKKVHSELEEFCDPSRNMKNYRDCLAASNPPIVPFLPIYLKDLTFINDGNASQVNGMVNFDKLRMMGKRVKDISSLAGTEFKFEANPAIQNYLAKPRSRKV
ncbi:ras guanine nucleotide exchange factor domain-containing protein [Chytridium lagenaria]|nr:ras guanine nucleotide exchange factor domain-containing protein [Chytridium lagenaria]